MADQETPKPQVEVGGNPKKEEPKKEVKPVVSAPVMPDLFKSQKPILCGKPEIILNNINMLMNAQLIL